MKELAMEFKVIITLQILLGIFSNSISEFQVENETENIKIPNQTNLYRHKNCWRNKKTLKYGQNNSELRGMVIPKKMALVNPFQPEAPPIYSFFTSPEKIQTQIDFVEERYFDQLIDHNDPSAGTFKQRYVVYKEFYQDNLEQGIHSERPQVFGIFGGEAAISKDDFFSYGFIMDDARRYNACCVILELRQYGNSTIGKDASVKNLEFLTIDQVLDDMARFIKFFNYEYKIKYKKWAFYGCSLAGEFVPRFAVRHSKLYEFGIAAAACRQTHYDFPYFYGTVGDVLGAISPKCRRIVKEAFDSVTDLVREARSKCEKTHPSHQTHRCNVAEKNTKILKKYLQICGKFSIFEEINTQEMIYDSTANLIIVAMYNNIAHTKYDDISLQDFCQDINAQPTTNQPYDSLRKFYEANCKLSKELKGLTLNTNDPNFVHCEDLCNAEIDWNKEVESLQQTDWTADVNVGGIRQWIWEVCQYAPDFTTASGPNSVFGDLLTTFYFQKGCDEIFKNRFNYANQRLTVSEKNKLYGGLKGIPGSCPSCTLFVVHGRDPWKKCGLLHENDINCGGHDNKFVLYSNGSHCSTSYPDNFDDPNDGYLKEAKREIHAAVDHWMSRGCKNLNHVQCPI